MIGRERERDLLQSVVARASEGRSAFVLIVGEPGIGKTTLLRALSELGARAGLAVGHGCGEPDGAAPLWPWRSALRDVEVLRGSTPMAFAGPSDERRADTADGVNREVEQFPLFERLSRDLAKQTAEGPLALVADDLHWADLSTLRFLRYLIHRPSVPGLVVAAGMRTTEPLAPIVSGVVSELLAHPSVEVVEISPFGQREVAAFAAEKLDRPPSDGEVDVLAQRSGGNPFLLGELLRWMPAAGSPADVDAALPLAVRESVRRRLVVEDAATQHVVKAAAVAGSAASLDLLARVAAVDGADAGRALDSAARAGLLVVDVDRGGAVSFAHDLVRQAVLSLLSTWDRVELHHAVGMTLRDGTSSWSALATHLAAARPLVDRATLAEAAERAAAEAMRAGAFDEAASHLGVALDVTGSGDDSAARGVLLLELGRVLWAAERPEESRVAMAAAITLARRTADSDLLAQVALSWRGGELRVVLSQADDQFLALLREALAALPPGDGRLRCLLLARLALCAHSDLDDGDGVAACEEAVAMAHRIGDREALAVALGTRFYYRWRPELVRERLAIADEILTLALAADDAGLIAQASHFRILALLELGWLREAWSELDRFETAVALCGHPVLKVRTLWLRATRHLALGQRGLADEAADEARRLADRLGRPDAAVERLGLALVLWSAEGRVDEALRLMSPALRHPVLYHSVVAMANGFGGRSVEAQAALSAVGASGLQRQRPKMEWMFGQCGLLTAAVVSRDRDAGRLLYEALEPFAGQWAVLNPGILVAGSVDHFLGLGAALLGRTGVAADHLRRAAQVHERQGAVPLALLSLHELRTVLARRQDPADDAELTTIGQRIELLDSTNTVPFKPLLDILWSGPDGAPVTHRQRLVLEGDTWLVEFGGARARLRDQRGLHHLKTLLERPGVEIPALTLAGADRSLAGSNEGALLDERAMREYRQRITDLHEDISEATANNDIERAAKAEAELDALIELLTAATGVGGRPRAFTGPDERARVSVTKAIRSAIGHLTEQLPELGRHLTVAVHTGGRCVYQPDPRTEHRWTTEQM